MAIDRRTGLGIMGRCACVAVAAMAGWPIVAAPLTVAWGTSNWEQDWVGATTESSKGFKVPDAAVESDTAVINQGCTVVVDSAVSVAVGDLLLANTDSGQPESRLNIDPGGRLTADGAVTISASADAGTLNIRGGALVTRHPVAVNKGGALNLSKGSFTNDAAGPRIVLQDTDGAGGAVNISGGTFTARGADPTDFLEVNADEINLSGGIVDMRGGQVLAADTTTISVIGGDADITMDRLNLNDPERAATLRFVFDESGVAAIKSNAFIHLGSATIEVDGSGYTGGPAVFDLLTTPHLASGARKVEITGLGKEGVGYRFTQSIDTHVVQIQVLKPAEPGG